MQLDTMLHNFRSITQAIFNDTDPFVSENLWKDLESNGDKIQYSPPNNGMIASTVKYLSPKKKQISVQDRQSSLLTLTEATHKKFHDVVKETVHPVEIWLCLQLEKSDSSYLTKAPSQYEKNCFDRLIEHITPFFQNAKNNLHPRINEFFKQNIFCNQCFNEFDRFNRYSLILVLYASLPEKEVSSLFRTIMKKSKRKSVKREKLNHLTINLNRSKIPTRSLHKCLKAFSEHVQQYHLNSTEIAFHLTPNLAYLEGSLVEADNELRAGNQLPNPDYALLTQIDQQHVKWRECLEEDSLLKSIEIQSVQGTLTKRIHCFVLGPLIHSKKDSFDKNVFFTVKSYHQHECSILAGEEGIPVHLENNRNISSSKSMQLKTDLCLLWIGINETALGLKYNLAAKRQPNLPLPKYTYIDPEGRFCLVSRLNIFINEATWHDLKPHRSNFQLFARSLCQQEMLPTPLDPQYMGFSEEGKFFGTRIFGFAPFSMNKIELFLYSTFNNDPSKFKAVMEESKILETPEACFLRNNAINALNNSHEQFPMLDNGWGKEKKLMLLEESENLKSNINFLYKQTLMILEKKRPSLFEKEQSKLIAIFMKTYLTSAGITLLMPNLTELVLAEFEDS